MTTKTSTLLKQTLAHLWAGGDAGNFTKEKYICHAADRIAGGKRVQELVMSRLDGCTTLSGWLDFKHPGMGDELGKLPAKRFNLAAQAYRRAWVESMIVEFKAKGD